ncbi:MAG: hypothetical protein A2X36_09920 [Elusimicrobia bacterium GWA2_69_24]|nr:MAG: hypothetical protein A2X36_09920 [Elusimicrobia bacterium GWA2_69_24]HBL17583.1 1-acyl-sn-glycerol-3-phosphate acyltransferase [Elusimicrobiota bacterium]
MKSRAEVDAFQRTLRETGSYRTDPSRPRAALGRFDSWYYLRLLRLVYLGHRLAARGEFDLKAWAAHSLTFLSIVEECGGTVELSGLEHPLKLGRPCVFVGNHMSLIEAFLLPGMLLHIGSIAPVIKESLLDYPLLGSFARAIDPIRVGRRSPKEDLMAVLDQGKKFLGQGRSVVLFPQATRAPRFDPSAFNTLGVKLARAAGVPVIPLALKTDFQRNGSLIKDLGTLDRSQVVHFRFGEPMTVQGTGKDVNESVVRFITESLREWDGQSGR